MNKNIRYARIAFQWLSDAGHKRFLAIALAIVASHILGHALKADDISAVMDIVIGGLGGAWVNALPEASQ